MHRKLQQLKNPERHTFFVAENGVWLTDAVPAEYLTQIDTPAR